MTNLPKLYPRTEEQMLAEFESAFAALMKGSTESPHIQASMRSAAIWAWFQAQAVLERRP